MYICVHLTPRHMLTPNNLSHDKHGLTINHDTPVLYANLITLFK